MAESLVHSDESSGGFRQTGVANWTDLSSRTVEFTFGALTRLSKANVDPATVGMGQALCLAFEIPHDIKKKVIGQIEKLPRISVYGNIAHFGFGLRHVLQDLCERDSGIICVSLCGCLKESYDSFYASQVFRMMCQIRDVPPEMIPGTQRWTAIIKVCAGVFTGTEFSRLLVGLTPLVCPRTSVGLVDVEATDPNALAKAILTLGEISKGSLESCTLTGGIDCAWLGALAVFLFGFSLSVEQADGTAIYQSSLGRHLPNRRSQVTIIRAVPTGSSSKIIQKSVFLPNGRDMFRRSAESDRNVSRFETRSSWDTILKDSFGRATEDLLEKRVRSSFVTILAFSARRQARPSDQNPVQRPEYKYDWPYVRYGSGAANGDAFLDLAYSALPELRPALEESNYQSLKCVSEQVAFEASLQIEEQCDCPACGNPNVKMENFTCLLALTGALVDLVALLSTMDIEDLLPTPFGLRRPYESLHPKRARYPRQWQREWPSIKPDLLTECATVFSTPSAFASLTLSSSKSLALSSAGVCCFYGLTADLECSRLNIAKVCIIPGHIENNGSTFLRIHNSPAPQGDISEFACPPLRKYGFRLVETIDSTTLQMACTTDPYEPGRGTSFQLATIINWAIEPRFQLEGPCSQTVALPEYVIVSRAKRRKTYLGRSIYLKSVWEVRLPYDSGCFVKKLCSEGINVAHVSQLSLLLTTYMLNTNNDVEILRIQKSSVDFWTQPEARLHHLCSEYGRLRDAQSSAFKALNDSINKAELEFDSSKVRIPPTQARRYCARSYLVELNDCPQCIIRSACSMLDRDVSIFRDISQQVIDGLVTVHGIQQTEEVKFESKRDERSSEREEQGEEEEEEEERENAKLGRGRFPERRDKPNNKEMFYWLKQVFV